jgi:hypothetical protein
VIVTRSTRAHRTPASQPYLSHVLDPAGVSPRLLRQTRLAEITHRLDPRLVAAAFGMTRRRAALPDRRHRQRSHRVRERLSAANDSPHLHANLCALLGWMFELIAIERFS